MAALASRGVTGARGFSIRVLLSGGVLCFLALMVATETESFSDPAGSVLTAGRATIRVLLRGPVPGVGVSGVNEWVLKSAAIVGGYFGEFPVPAVTIRVTIAEGASMGSGKTYGYPQPRIEVTVGQGISAKALNDDWVLIHEMTHLALPGIGDDHNWLAEGVAVYVEGVARTQAGNMTEEELWQEYATSMPKGLPQSGDQGLDRTHTWARTYWGGALYCLVADVRIREKTNNRRGLLDALRAIARTGGGMSREWPVERILSVGDAATDTTVMTDLYLRMKDHPYAPDLSLLWSDLGVVLGDGVIRFNEAARLAAVRRAITHTPAP